MHIPGGGTSECFFHEGKPAVTRCKQCGRPICSDCRLITEDGVFCGDKCAQTTRVFTKRVQDLEERKPRRRRIPAGVTRFVVFIIIVFVIYKIGRYLVGHGYIDKLMQYIRSAD